MQNVFTWEALGNHLNSDQHLEVVGYHWRNLLPAPLFLHDFYEVLSSVVHAISFPFHEIILATQPVKLMGLELQYLVSHQSVAQNGLDAILNHEMVMQSCLST